MMPWPQGAALARHGPARACSPREASATAASSADEASRAPPPTSSPALRRVTGPARRRACPATPSGPENAEDRRRKNQRSHSLSIYPGPTDSTHRHSERCGSVSARDPRRPPVQRRRLRGYGFDLVEVDQDMPVFEARAGEQHYNPIGVVHGENIAMTLLDFGDRLRGAVADAAAAALHHASADQPGRPTASAAAAAAIPRPRHGCDADDYQPISGELGRRDRGSMRRPSITAAPGRRGERSARLQGDIRRRARADRAAMIDVDAEAAATGRRQPRRPDPAPRRTRTQVKRRRRSDAVVLARERARPLMAWWLCSSPTLSLRLADLRNCGDGGHPPEGVMVQRAPRRTEYVVGAEGEAVRAEYAVVRAPIVSIRSGRCTMSWARIWSPSIASAPARCAP